MKVMEGGTATCGGAQTERREGAVIGNRRSRSNTGDRAKHGPPSAASRLFFVRFRVRGKGVVQQRFRAEKASVFQRFDIGQIAQGFHAEGR